MKASRFGLGCAIFVSACIGWAMGCGPSNPLAVSPAAKTADSSGAAAVSSVSPSGSSRGASGSKIPDGNMERSAIPDSFKWQLSALFASDDAFESAITEASEARKKLITFKGTLAKPQSLYECLDLYFKTRLLSNKLTLYANQRFDTDQKNTHLQGMNDRALDAMNDLVGKAVFVRKEIMGYDDASLLRAYKAEPKLSGYRPYIEELRRRKSRVLSADAEKALSLAGDNLWAEIDLNEIPSDHEKTFGALLSDVPLPKIHDSKGAEVQLTLSNYNRFRAADDRRVRQDTVESFFQSLKQYQHAFAGTLAGQVRFNVFLARSRGYETAREAYLDKDNINPAVYDNLLRTVNSNLAPLHRYIRLRKQIMGVEQLHIYDLYTPMVPTVEMRFSYEEAQRVLPEALSPLGEDYVKVLRQGLDSKNGWVDLYPHKDKKSGAFCSSVFGVHPFVKMNYFEDVDDLSTLAHEFGHALHSHLAMTNQPYVSSNYSAFTAEIASTFNEKLLSDYLLAHAKTDDEKLYLLNELVDKIRTTIYRQSLFAEFEHATHVAAEKGQPLTAASLSETYGKLLRTYYGPDFSVGANDDIEWAYIPHFYYKYYVFSYATGLSSGIALAQGVAEKGAPARDAYLGMLKGGSSRPPLDLLKSAGVDLTRPDAIEAAARLMDKSLGQMEEILAKRKK